MAGLLLGDGARHGMRTPVGADRSGAFSGRDAADLSPHGAPAGRAAVRGSQGWSPARVTIDDERVLKLSDRP